MAGHDFSERNSEYRVLFVVPAISRWPFSPWPCCCLLFLVFPVLGPLLGRCWTQAEVFGMQGRTAQADEPGIRRPISNVPA